MTDRTDREAAEEIVQSAKTGQIGDVLWITTADTSRLVDAITRALHERVERATALLDRFECGMPCSHDGGKTFQPWPFEKRVEIACMAATDEEDKRLLVAAEVRCARLVEALQVMIDEKVDYMTINHLGDPEAQHTIKMARAALTDTAKGDSQ